MTNETIRILIADDHHILRGGLQAIIDVNEDLKVVGHASDGVEAVEQYRLLAPDVIIMDLVMPLKDGMEAIREICAGHPGARILVLTSFSEMDKIMPAIQAGALGYFLKSAPPKQIIEAIRSVDKGRITIQPEILQQIFRQGDPKQSLKEETPAEPLTAREYEVLKLVARGLSNDEIAEMLILSKRTVNLHINHINEKLGLANRAQMVLYALQHGFFESSS
jgi:two-component system, NarL family, response regulator LiaR